MSEIERKRSDETNLLGSKVATLGNVEDGELSLVSIANGSAPAKAKRVSTGSIKSERKKRTKFPRP